MGFIVGLLGGLITLGVDIALSFHHLSYFHVVGLLFLSILVGSIIQRLTPKFVQVTQINKE